MSNYSVNLWGSNPLDNNDDCWSGRDFDTEKEALECFWNIESYFKSYELESTRYVEVTSTKSDFYEVRPVEGYVTDSDDSDWEREMAREAGMLGGCDGYNDFYGY